MSIDGQENEFWFDWFKMDQEWTRNRLIGLEMDLNPQKIDKLDLKWIIIDLKYIDWIKMDQNRS